MTTGLLIIAGIFLSIALFNFLVKTFAGFDEPVKILPDDALPHIAVLVAARNEENNISKCLQSLVNQDYPADKIQILVGNDQSTDNTRVLVDQFVRQYQNITQVHITAPIGKARGKANVLAQLAHQTNAAYFLITDADIETRPGWARNLVSFFNPKTGIVSGTTVVTGSSLWERMQQADWLYFMGLLLTFDKIGMHSTAVGNNMAISRDAYLSTGGYENFDFSVTEDYKLFEQVRSKGWKTINMCNPASINFSAAAADIKTLLNQRKRWLTGAKDLPFYWWLIFGIYGFFMPVFILLLFLNVKLALALYAIRFIIQASTIAIQLKKIRLQIRAFDFLFYEAYSIIITLCTAFYFIIPVKLNWKNRYYS